MKFFSTFSGIGGFEVGIQNAWLSTETRRHDGELLSMPDLSNGNGWWSNPACVGYSEIDKYAISVYEKHFKGVKNYGDITKIKAEDLPDFDCLVGGFPCQAFSIAGKRGGFNDTRGTLFFDLARILREKQPRLCVFENVKGLLSHDQGRTFRTIITTLDELGYNLQWQLLNSKNFGVPQNRERVIIVGHLRGTPRPQVFPIAETGGTDNSKSKRHTTGTIKTRAGDSQNDNTFIIEDTEQYKVRRLTPLECERLQAFPDNWTKYDKAWNIISDTQRYKMCGNAITTNVIQAVFERIFAQEEDRTRLKEEMK